jgi:hypothetical protein
MNLWQHYVCPATLSDALLALRDAPGPASPLGGGTDLLIDLEQGRHSPANTLVDLSSVVRAARKRGRSFHRCRRTFRTSRASARAQHWKLCETRAIGDHRSATWPPSVAM